MQQRYLSSSEYLFLVIVAALNNIDFPDLVDDWKSVYPYPAKEWVIASTVIEVEK